MLILGAKLVEKWPILGINLYICADWAGWDADLEQLDQVGRANYVRIRVLLRTIPT